MSDIDWLERGCHVQPHAFLGLHSSSTGQIIRLWRPGAVEVYLEVLGSVVQAMQLDPRGLFVYVPSSRIRSTDYKIYHQSALKAHDPYAFWPQVGETDCFLFNKGCHYKLFDVLGAHVKQVDLVEGVSFAVWAPNAKGVNLIADCNHFDGRVLPMRSMGSSGIWELFVPGIGQGEKYKFEVRGPFDQLSIKSDPFAFFSELRPKTASIVWDLSSHTWEDEEWMRERQKKQALGRPINVYEVHLGSWRSYEASFPTYRQLAFDLAEYCQKMGFSHVELLPMMEHPLDESWGYQVSGFYAVTSRYGTPSDFQYFVDYLHSCGIGVILDWVPAHFPLDDFSLARFDGTALYEHEDPRKGLHPHWQTAIFNYGRKEVVNFLIGSALFWCEMMHIDGLRVDAVASILYLDYGRKAGEWIPNPDGGNINGEAVEFLKHLNSIVHERSPGVLMIAEESSSYMGVTHQEGLGFDLKWNMGWMNDTLQYFSRDPIYRKFHQNELTFSLLYAFSERFMSVLSHDEVVHGKKSLLSKMPGPDWQKFANVRLLYSYMMCHPGKKLLFMGGEIGQWNEWNAGSFLDWHLLESPLHRGLWQLVQEMNHFYHHHPALWEQDFSWEGYEWIDFSDAERCVTVYLRKSSSSQLICVHNFTPEFYPSYWIALRQVRQMREVFNTDEERYGGSGKINSQCSLEETGVRIAIAPLATLIFEVEFA
ncbi:MAG: 1,4-alpha-glucan branching protein GlgB [Chlamydiales bacterium]|nr:1,4-alpha-glucan branching protein GlgB [Chlamydiales bacterium]